DLKRFSSVVIQRHGAVQKHTAVNPVAIHSKLKTVIPSERDSSFLRTCRWGGCSKIILWLCKGQPGRLRARQLAPRRVQRQSPNQIGGLLTCPIPSGGVALGHGETQLVMGASRGIVPVRACGLIGSRAKT